MTVRHLSLERLEPRWLLDGSYATLATSGASWSPSQNSLIIDFNINVTGWLNPGDVLLEPDNAGVQTPLLGDATYSQQTATATATSCVATIPVLSQPLPPGHYSIVLVDDPNSTEIIWGLTANLTLGDFTVLPPPVVQPPATLYDATVLQTPIGTQVLVRGSLDLSSQENVDLYQITLAPGHFWRLGVELDAERIGSGLLGALTLFDSNGKVLATRDSGTGLPDFPDDPYLFAGLPWGVYYIGVSGAGNLGNLPGQSGGYDPVTGTMGTLGDAQAGGLYHLQIVADPADSLTQVTGLSLQRADPLDPTPTGLTLTFSGAIDPNSLRSNSPILVYNASGKPCPMTPSSYEGSQVSFVFNQPLPPGQYTVAVPPSGGLTDLTGRAPVSPGNTPGVLATFTVKSETSSAVAGNLGILWPSAQAEVSQFATIAPGQTVVSRVVIPATGFYVLYRSFTQGSVAITQLGPYGSAVVDPATLGPSQSYRLPLAAGIYYFSFSAAGSQSAQVHWTLVPGQIDFEWLVNNGVSQSPALDLRLVDATPWNSTLDSPPSTGPMLSGDVAPVSSPTNPQSGTVIVSVPTSEASGGAVSATGLAPIPASLLVTVNTGLLGSPSAQSEQVAVVGPVAAGGSIALAGSFPGLPPGIFLGSSGSLDQRAPKQTDPGPVAGNSSATDAELAESGSSSSATPGVILASASSADAQALTRADRITELAGRLGRWFGLKTGQEGATIDGALADSDLLARNETEPGRGPADGSAESSTERMTEADLGMPTGLVVVAAAAYRLRQLAGRWWRRTRGQVRDRHDRR